jgi:hypothetical protein
VTDTPTSPVGEIVWLTDLLPELGVSVHGILELVAEEMDFDPSFTFTDALAGCAEVFCDLGGVDPELAPHLRNEAVRHVVAAAGYPPTRLFDPRDTAVVAAIDAAPALVRRALIDRAIDRLRLPTPPTRALARSAMLTTSAPMAKTTPTPVANKAPTVTGARPSAHHRT